MSREFGEVAYTLSNLIVATYNYDANTYGTPATVADGQMLVSEPEADNDKLRGYGKYTRGLSVVIGAKVRTKFGGVDFSILPIIIGSTNSTSGSDPNFVRTTDIAAGGAGLPYFGVIGTAPTDDGGLAVIGLQAVKLDTVPSWTMDGERNKFNLSEAMGYAFPISNRLQRVRTYKTASDFVAPTSGANFLAFFA